MIIDRVFQVYEGELYLGVIIETLAGDAEWFVPRTPDGRDLPWASLRATAADALHQERRRANR